MNMSNVTKLYACFKAGFLGSNILDTYFSFVANIIIDNSINTIEDSVIQSQFKERYSIELPLPFIRQVLGVGVHNNCFIEDHGQYSVVHEEIIKYRFDESDFDALWSYLITDFKAFCDLNNIDISSIDVEDFILNSFDDSDDIILYGEKAEKEQGLSSIQYAWYSFVRDRAETKPEMYKFITALSASNITIQALFYAGDTSSDYHGLDVYLDSPIVFALLGMDEAARTESYKKLIIEMQKANCNIHIFDHIFQEVDCIIANASTWATSTQYDLRKANNAARFLHDSEMDEEEIAEFCGSIEDKLNELGITIKETDYDIFQKDFQEDESQLFDMVKTRYTEQGNYLSKEKESSILIDVRSIIMVYRERKGQVASRIQNSKHIMLTSNNAIANVSKQYESNKSLKSGHIPACVSVDLFGAILWLNSPLQMIEYQKKKLLADCYAFLKPDKKMIDKYMQSLDDARNADEIDEKTFLFLRTHKVVLDSLMNITRGDYARFNSKTYIEVYEDIQSKSQQMYRDEAEAHKQTRKELEDVKEKASKEREENKETIGKLQERIETLEDNERKREKRNLEKRINICGWIITIVFAGIPYVLLLVLFEWIKAGLTSLDPTWETVIKVAIVVVITIIIAPFFKKVKTAIFNKVRLFFYNKFKLDD